MQEKRPIGKSGSSRATRKSRASAELANYIENVIEVIVIGVKTRSVMSVEDILIDYTVSESDYNSPENIKAAMVKAEGMGLCTVRQYRNRGWAAYPVA